jgi:hypothetical protein
VTPHELKVMVNLELDASAQRHMGRVMTFHERRAWWTSPQGGIEEPYLAGFNGTNEDHEAILKAAREWKP